jgi:adenylate cyclase
MPTAQEYYDDAVRIRENPAKFNAAGIVELRQLLEKAIEEAIEDELKSRAYAELAYTYVRFYQQGWTTNPGAALEKAEELANEALRLNDDFDSRWNLAIVYWNQGKFDESFAEYDLARGHSPGASDLADLEADEAEARIYSGDLQIARDKIQAAKAGNPNHPYPYWYDWNDARLCYMEKDYQGAINAIGQMTQPNDVLLITAASKAQLGEVAAARTYMAQFSQNDPEWSIAKAGERYFRRWSDRQNWLDGLRNAGLKEQ